MPSTRSQQANPGGSDDPGAADQLQDSPPGSPPVVSSLKNVPDSMGPSTLLTMWRVPYEVPTDPFGKGPDEMVRFEGTPTTIETCFEMAVPFPVQLRV